MGMGRHHGIVMESEWGWKEVTVRTNVTNVGGASEGGKPDRERQKRTFFLSPAYGILRCGELNGAVSGRR